MSASSFKDENSSASEEKSLSLSLRKDPLKISGLGLTAISTIGQLDSEHESQTMTNTNVSNKDE